MTELALGSLNVITKDLTTAATTEVVTFAGGCIATATISAGKDMGTLGRQTSIVHGSIDGAEVASAGVIDLEGSAGHNSAGPQSVTIAVPVGSDGEFTVSGGKPSVFKVTLVRNSL